MSDNESWSSNDEQSESPEFNPWFLDSHGEKPNLKYLRGLQHVPGEELGELLPQDFTELHFWGQVSREFEEYERVQYLLQSSRGWEKIGLSDLGSERATPEFLTLVVLALTKTNSVTLNQCPMDENFFGCLNSGMQTLTHVKMASSTISISYNAAAIFANGLALSRSLKNLSISQHCQFEPGAGLKLMEGIKRNKSLKFLELHEHNLSMTRSVAMTYIINSISEGCLPQLLALHVWLEEESGCTNALTKLISSDTCQVETLVIGGSSNIFQSKGIQMGRPNLALKSLRLSYTLLDESFLAMMLPMVPGLSHLSLSMCGMSDVAPIVDHLCHPSTAIKSIDLSFNSFGIEIEKFVESLVEMRSLTDIKFRRGSLKRDTSDERERATAMLRKVSTCWNLETFSCPYGKKKERAELRLSMAINRAWRRELCYKKSSPPSKLLPLVIARALRKTEESLRADIILPLLRERISDLMPPRNE